MQLEPIGLVFVVCFGTILIIQFTAMLIHRFSTLTHMLVTTQITWFKRAAQVGTVNSITQ
jgi:chitin synthase